MPSTRLVVVGGFGNFGARICRRLAIENGAELIATGRSAGKPMPGVERAALDLSAPSFASDLAALRPDVVIHCAGPFQGQDYRAARAALACGAHYLDIADARSFVAEFGAALDAEARAAGCIAISGASTLPALSSAVVNDLHARFASIESIDIVIAPGQKAPRGVATMGAVLGYAGAPIRWWVDGKWQTTYGWQAMRRVSLPFGDRWASVCDVPDLEIFPEHYSGVRTVRFRAALEFGIEHWALWLVAALRRWGWLGAVGRWASLLNRASDWLDPFGGPWGGMSVEIRGQGTADAPLALRWTVKAPALHGPEIPCMAAELLALRLVRGEPLAAGARACLVEIPLSAFRPEFERWSICEEVTELPA
jgi:hypothetical protein